MPQLPPDETPRDTYEPDTIEVNRGRERGLGVGQKDIDYQRDPMGVVPAERWVNTQPSPRVRPLDPLPPELDPPPRGFEVPGQDKEQDMPQKSPRPEEAPARKAEAESQGFPRIEPQSYVAADPREASLAPPAARQVGEMVEDLREDFIGDEEEIDDSYGEVQMGGDRRMIPGKEEAVWSQGRKTVHANKERLHSPVRSRR